MARYTGPKRGLSRREGVNLFDNPKLGVEKGRGVQPPGQHGKRMSRRASDYGKQLREKQKTKRMYGLMEKQFRRLYEEASKTPGNTGIRLLQLLETRLDNVIYRAGFVSSRPAARQLVTHGHVLVDGKKVNIPSYQMKIGQIVTLKTPSLEIPDIKASLDGKKVLPEWMERKATVSKIARLPERTEIDAGINEQLIIEFYSR